MKIMVWPSLRGPTYLSCEGEKVYSLNVSPQDKGEYISQYKESFLLCLGVRLLVISAFSVEKDQSKHFIMYILDSFIHTCF